MDFYKTVKEHYNDYLNRAETLNGVIIIPEADSFKIYCGYLIDSLPVEGVGADKYNAIMDFIKGRITGFSEPHTVILGIEEIKGVLRERKVKMALDFISGRVVKPIKLFSINKSHPVKNGDFLSINNDYSICLFSPHENNYETKDEWEVDLMDIFLHELGHAFHYTLTLDMEVLPKGFKELATDIWEWMTPSVIDKEMFADFFSCAMASNTSMANTNPLCLDLSDNSKKIERYFLELICHREIGDKQTSHSWQKLPRPSKLPLRAN